MDAVSAQPQTNTRADEIEQLEEKIKTVENRLRNLKISSRYFFKAESSGASAKPGSYEETQEEYKKLLEKESADLAAFKVRHTGLFHENGTISDVQFDTEYTGALKEITEILEHLNGHFIQKAASLPGRFVDVSTVTSLDQFIDMLPMQFIPRKEDVWRIITIAQEMQTLRVGKEKDAHLPIRIADIGGANGTLGKLVTDLAKENNIAIEYTIVDPDVPTLRDSANFYKDNTSLKFFEGTGEDFNHGQFKDKAPIQELFLKRTMLAKEGDRKRADLLKIAQEITVRDTIPPESITEYLATIKADFGVALSAELINDPKKFISEFNREVCLETWLWSKKLKAEIDAVTLKLEALIAEVPEQFDLVINSWMPVATDFTREIREANGAAIMYAVDRYGATGCRSDSVFREYPEGFSEEESFNPRAMYESKFGWVSHSTPEVLHMKEGKHATFWKDEGETNPAFGNGFIVQVKKKYAGYALEAHVAKMMSKAKKAYAWEHELDEKGGPLSPTCTLEDQNGMLDYFLPLDNLAKEIGKKEEKKGKKRRTVFGIAIR